MRLIMRAMSNIVISIHSSTDSSRACATGRIPRFIATSARDCFRKIGPATAKRAAISANGNDRAWARGGGLRLRLIRPTGYGLSLRFGDPNDPPWTPRNTQSRYPSVKPAPIPSLEKTDLSSRFNVICPVQTLQQKYSSSHLPPNQGHNSAVLFRSRGVGRRHERWDEMRWTRQRRARTRSQGGCPVSDHRAPDERRQSPAKPFGEDGWLRTAKSCGPGTRCWCQVGGGFANPTRLDQIINPPTTAPRRIRPRGKPGISHKTIAQGTPGCSDCTCMLVCAFFFARCTRDRGCSKHPAFPAPSVSRAKNSSNDPGVSRRGVMQSRREVLISM